MRYSCQTPQVLSKRVGLRKIDNDGGLFRVRAAAKTRAKATGSAQAPASGQLAWVIARAADIRFSRGQVLKQIEVPPPEGESYCDRFGRAHLR